MRNRPHNLSDSWPLKTKEILKSSSMSVAKKILAYKVFLRPLLIFEWFEGRDREMKILEIQALKRIFATANERTLYKRYTDVDVTRYMKLQEIRWRRATGSDFGNLRRMLQELSKTCDPSPYFTRAGRGNKHPQHKPRCRRCPSCRSQCSSAPRHTFDVSDCTDCVSICTYCASSTRKVRRSARVANKKRMHYSRH